MLLASVPSSSAITAQMAAISSCLLAIGAFAEDTAGAAAGAVADGAAGSTGS